MHLLHTSAGLDALLDDCRHARVVMLGEASHGTHEFYTWRTAITRRLVTELGFSFVAVEGDWPDCYKINRYIKGHPDAGTEVLQVLHSFDRWPTWMWANWEVAALAEWLRAHNKKAGGGGKVGFYGLDVYSLWDSMREMMTYLEKEDPAAAQLVKSAIQCFQPYEDNEHAYARMSLTEHSCRDQVLALLKDIRLKAQHLDGEPEAGFNTEQNALIAVNAEKYYRSMMRFDNESWNVRDRHMMETLERLLNWHGPESKAVVWEHNTHIGDARATNMQRAGMVNIGQLARERWGNDAVYLVGFGSYEGTVIAGEAWGALMVEMEVPPAREGSVEHLLHQESPQNRYLLFRDRDTAKSFRNPLPHRAIGVVYDPRREKTGNYVPSLMPERYDAFIYLDQTRALHPLHLQPTGKAIPDLYPFGV